MSQLIAALDQAFDLFFDQLFGMGRHREPRRVARIAFMRLGIVNIAHFVRHAPTHHHGARQLAGLLNIASRAVGNLVFAIFQNFCRFTGHGHGQPLFAF